MSSSYKSLDLFGSGPHRFAVLPVGLYVLPFRVFDPTLPGSASYGNLELEVHVTGRLVAASDAALWTLRDAIAAQAVHPATAGTLIDQHGRSWTSMTLREFEHGDRTDRGRVVSIAYVAKFRKFL